MVKKSADQQIGETTTELLELRRNNTLQARRIQALQTALEKKQQIIRKSRQNNALVNKQARIIEVLRDALARERQLWDAASEEDRRSMSKSELHSMEVINDILTNPDSLAAATGITPEEFQYIYDKFVAESKKRKRAPLFTEDNKPDPGNRCRLSRRYALLMNLMRKKLGITQAVLGILFRVDQSTISRYIQFVDSILTNTLPTADKMAKMVRSAKTEEEFEKIIPGKTLIADGTETPRQRPQKSEERKKTYSGKNKRFTNNTTIVTNKKGLIVWAGKPREGAAHDMGMLADEPIALGRWSRSMRNPRTPENKRITVLADKGYQGITNLYPGIKAVIPVKKPKGKELSARKKKRNKKISSKRVIVEHSIGRIKQWGMMRQPYDGTIESFGKELMVVTGLVNQRLLWDSKKKRPKINY